MWHSPSRLWGQRASPPVSKPHCGQDARRPHSRDGLCHPQQPAARCLVRPPGSSYAGQGRVAGSSNSLRMPKFASLCHRHTASAANWIFCRPATIASDARFRLQARRRCVAARARMCQFTFRAMHWIPPGPGARSLDRKIEDKNMRAPSFCPKFSCPSHFHFSGREQFDAARRERRAADLLRARERRGKHLIHRLRGLAIRFRRGRRHRGLRHWHGPADIRHRGDARRKRSELVGDARGDRPIGNSGVKMHNCLSRKEPVRQVR